MNRINLTDTTMKQVADGFSLSFKEKIELAKLLDKLGVSVIELEGIQNERIDSLRIKSIAAAVTNSVIAVPVSLTAEGVSLVWAALQQAKFPRLQVCGAVSAVQMGGAYQMDRFHPGIVYRFCFDVHRLSLLLYNSRFQTMKNQYLQF